MLPSQTLDKATRCSVRLESTLHHYDFKRKRLCPHTTSCPCSSAYSSCSEPGCFITLGTSAALPVLRSHLARTFPVVSSPAPRSIALPVARLLCLRRSRS